MSTMGVVRGQGMCPHEGVTCILKIINPREGSVGVNYGGCEGARDVST